MRSSHSPRATDPAGTACATVCALILTAVLSTGPGCATQEYISVRRVPNNPLADSLQLLSRKGPQPTIRTKQLLRRYDLSQESSDQVLAKLQDEIAREPLPEKLYAFAELAYVQGKRAELLGNKGRALDRYGASVAHAYWYLFDPSFDPSRNPYDPQFRGACDVYNGALEAAMRIMQSRGQLRPGATYRIDTEHQQFHVQIASRGRWQSQDFERLEFVSDYEVKGLTNRYHTYGLGVPLIAVRRQGQSQDAAERFYPPGLSFAVTAFLRVMQPAGTPQRDVPNVRRCVLELQDTVAVKDVDTGRRLVPLETDLTTPLAYFLDNPDFKQREKVATWALLKPARADSLKGLYMLEPYEPSKIPVLMIHGLWSSPVTWMEMFNDLRSFPEIRDQYQFWFYLYPTGQPYWVSARQLRSDLTAARDVLDPQRSSPALDQMVLVGHSMGGLVAKLQTLESGNDFWSILSERPFDDLQAEPQTRERLAQTVFFHPNRSIRRVITIATPHRGSDFANDYTRWLGRKLITLPEIMVAATQQIKRDNPGLFRDTEMLSVNTSIDSLSPDSPVLSAVLHAQKAAWTKYHNVVGLVPKEGIVASLAAGGDGVVKYESAHLADVESEITVEADHVNVHRHPRSILEVRRILLEHRLGALAEMQSGPPTVPVSYPGHNTACRADVTPAERDTAIAAAKAYLGNPEGAEYLVISRDGGYWVQVRFATREPGGRPTDGPEGQCTVVVSPDGRVMGCEPAS